jgi:hypothetical protein
MLAAMRDVVSSKRRLGVISVAMVASNNHLHVRFASNRDGYIAAYCAGNGEIPTSLPPQLGNRSVASLSPHTVQRADSRRRSLDTSTPHLIISGTKASGA